MFIASLVLALSTIGCADIPDAAAMLRDVRAHQQELEAVRENYTFHRIRQTDDVDARGRVTKTETAEREIFFVNGRAIGRLVKKNGIALDGQGQKAEEARVKKAVEAALKGPPRTPAAGRATLISDILAVSKVSNPRRISVKGRSTLAYDFMGDPAARAKTMEQNAVKKISGTIWFDEEDRQVAQLEITLDDNFKIGGGLLASVRKGTTVKLNQGPVGEGLWMQTSNEQHIDVRILVKGTRQNIHVEDFDFKRFDVGTVQRLETPRK